MNPPMPAPAGWRRTGPAPVALPRGPIGDPVLVANLRASAAWLWLLVGYDTPRRCWRFYQPNRTHDALLAGPDNPALRDPGALSDALRWATQRLADEDAALRRLRLADGRDPGAVRRVHTWLPVEYHARIGWLPVLEFDHAATIQQASAAGVRGHLPPTTSYPPTLMPPGPRRRNRIRPGHDLVLPAAQPAMAGTVSGSSGCSPSAVRVEALLSRCPAARRAGSAGMQPAPPGHRDRAMAVAAPAGCATANTPVPGGTPRAEHPHPPDTPIADTPMAAPLVKGPLP